MILQNSHDKPHPKSLRIVACLSWLLFLLFKHKLIVVEFGVEAVEFEELAMVALLDDFSVFEDDDFIRVENGFEAVGNDEAGPSCDNSLHSF